MSRRPLTATTLRHAGRRGRALLLASAAALVLAGCQHGADGFNDGSSNDEAPDVAMVRKLMEGLGAVDARSEQKIEYAPRAPLAMPTKMTELPQPEEKKEIANWPEQGETDLQRIQQAYRDTRDIDRQGRSDIYQSRGIKELATGGQNRDIQQEIQLENRLEDARMKPNELNQRVGVARKETAVLDENGNPVRRYLIEPPVAYSTPAAGAPLPQVGKVDDQPKVSDMERLMSGQSARTLR
ncbi:hypothetical protein [Stappia indica]|uniref:Beta-barrel assembly machine subunit BamF n=1 Tax=Stappia indica TaxID=538381 RepID=A0A857CCP9_9HYPH|nr:hypothetical protein [Stappia indica]QGZ36242.1 hypothetical protein GH266_18160 [Stappia indica]